ncbi:MAG: helix-turn-helix transcriptional regulator [Ruminococcaceae bacterium]|nr:helix-turn-helix transcriptional regulator [Oscillospiraceae bacterium]
MKNTNLKNVLTLNIRDREIKVFRTGKSLTLTDSRTPAAHPDTMQDIHSHFTYEIFFACGRLEIATDAVSSVYERKAVIIRPGVRHYTYAPDGDCYCLLLSGNGSETTEDITAVPLSDECCEYIGRAAQKYEKSSEKEQNDVRFLIELVLNEVLDGLGFYHSASKNIKREKKHINAIEQYINANIFEKITLGDVSRHTFLSTRQISRIIFAEYGCSLSQIVKSKKLDAAEILIKNTDMKISDIAARVNIGSENYFYCVFKEKYGMSPTHYRKENRKD